MVLRTKKQGPEIAGDPAFVFFEVEAQLVPFAVVSLEDHGPRELILTVEEIVSASEALEYAGSNVWISESDVRSPRRTMPETDIRGYRVVDMHLGPMGTVEDILEISRNPLLSVANGEKEFLMPFHEDIVLKIDPAKKTVTVDLPEGLTEI